MDRFGIQRSIALFFYVAVSFRFTHRKFTDQKPFRFIDQDGFPPFFPRWIKISFQAALNARGNFPSSLTPEGGVGFEVGFGSVNTPYSATLS